MRYIAKILALLVIPLLIAGMSIHMKDTRGPFWLGLNSDPDYAYLFNSLNLCVGVPPWHVDHPGTTLHVLGAAVISTCHRFLTSAGGSPSEVPADLVGDVLMRPEFYMERINDVLVALVVLALIGAGIVVLIVTGSLLLAVVFQFGAVAAAPSLAEMSRVRPEALLVALTCLFGAAIVAYTEKARAPNQALFAALFGVLAGLGVSTKISALPFGVVGLLLLPSWRARSLFLLTAGLVFLVSVVPIVNGGRMGYFADWLLRLITRESHYGGGPAGFFNPSRYFVSVKELLVGNRIFSIVVLVSAVGAFWSSRNSRDVSGLGRIVSKERVLAALTAAQVLSLLVTAKQARFEAIPYLTFVGHHYLIPALGLLGVNVVTGRGLVRERIAGDRAYRTAAAVFVVAAVCSEGWSVADQLKREEALKAAQIQVYAESLKYPDNRIICYYRASSPLYAMSFGNYFAGLTFGKELQDAHPDFVTFDIWEKSYHRFGEMVPRERIAGLLEKAMFQGSPLGTPPYQLDVGVVQIFSAGIEGLWRPVSGPRMGLPGQ